jgi:hypothetical protein
MPLLGHDLFVIRGSDEAFLLFFEILLVGERQGLSQLLLLGDSIAGRQLAL